MFTRGLGCLFLFLQCCGEALQKLEPSEREIIVLRGIEQLSNQEICRALDLQPSAVSMRYRRALGVLRTQLPGSLFDDLPEP